MRGIQIELQLKTQIQKCLEEIVISKRSIMAQTTELLCISLENPNFEGEFF